MIKVVAAVGAVVLFCLPNWAQETANLPNAPSAPGNTPAIRSYEPPTQKERFRAYLRHTYGIYSIVEAGIRGGIEQARDSPSQWPEGAEGYADRFGSTMGQITARGTTEYLVADAFREDLRFIPCAHPCSESKVHRALEDTFTARKGQDGHRAFSMARLAGPIAGSAIATNTWYPSGYRGAETAKQIGMSYSFTFLRNYVRELSH
jgi:hypothetical protein